jgi:hypothetical protein
MRKNLVHKVPRLVLARHWYCTGYKCPQVAQQACCRLIQSYVSANRALLSLLREEFVSIESLDAHALIDIDTMCIVLVHGGVS